MKMQEDEGSPSTRTKKKKNLQVISLQGSAFYSDIEGNAQVETPPKPQAKPGNDKSFIFLLAKKRLERNSSRESSGESPIKSNNKLPHLITRSSFSSYSQFDSESEASSPEGKKEKKYKGISNKSITNEDSSNTIPESPTRLSPLHSNKRLDTIIEAKKEVERSDSFKIKKTLKPVLDSPTSNTNAETLNDGKPSIPISLINNECEKKESSQASLSHRKSLRISLKKIESFSDDNDKFGNDDEKSKKENASKASSEQTTEKNDRDSITPSKPVFSHFLLSPKKKKAAHNKESSLKFNNTSIDRIEETDTSFVSNCAFLSIKQIDEVPHTSDSPKNRLNNKKFSEDDQFEKNDSVSPQDKTKQAELSPSAKLGRNLTVFSEDQTYNSFGKEEKDEGNFENLNNHNNQQSGSNPNRPRRMTGLIKADSENLGSVSCNTISQRPILKERTIKNDIENHLYRKLIFSPTLNEEIFKKHTIITCKGVNYALKNLKNAQEEFLKEKSVELPPLKKPGLKTLILDLDETLIHTCKIRDQPQYVLKPKDDKNIERPLGVNVRPYCWEFLKKMRKYYEIYIFTASSAFYCKTVASFLDPDGTIFSGLFSREHCFETKNGFCIKDLRLFKNRKIENIVIVDNLAHSFGYQINNGVPILEWIDDYNDTELKYLGRYLRALSKKQDVRLMNMETFKLEELGQTQVSKLFQI